MLTWSKKYENCIKCGTTEIRHKWRWLCLHCYDKLRSKRPNRVKLKRKITREWARRNRENVDMNHKVWYEKNKDILCVLTQWRYAKKVWKEVLQVYNRHIPMNTLKNPDLFKRVRDYIEKNQKLVGKKNSLIIW